MLLYIVIAHDDEGQPYVAADYTDRDSAQESASDCGGYVEAIDTFTTEPKCDRQETIWVSPIERERRLRELEKGSTL